MYRTCNPGVTALEAATFEVMHLNYRARLDYIFMRGDLRVLTSEIDEEHDTGADHCPVLTSFDLESAGVNKGLFEVYKIPDILRIVTKDKDRIREFEESKNVEGGLKQFFSQQTGVDDYCSC